LDLPSRKRLEIVTSHLESSRKSLNESATVEVGSPTCRCFGGGSIALSFRFDRNRTAVSRSEHSVSFFGKSGAFVLHIHWEL
jgi:hypothetical protein